ncbi:hypothetical protein [Rhizobium sp. RCC_161_2]|uniref:hypothetical protein n=1 Tax=Rhizobium sp. RCC_161_2 TaxID=3239219 RepID=UPI003523743D
MLHKTLQLIETMQRYFATKHKLKTLKGVLEEARRKRRETIASFYDLHKNVSFATQITQFVELKKQMDYLLIEAEKLVEIPDTLPDDVDITGSVESPVPKD